MLHVYIDCELQLIVLIVDSSLSMTGAMLIRHVIVLALCQRAEKWGVRAQSGSSSWKWFSLWSAVVVGVRHRYQNCKLWALVKGSYSELMGPWVHVGHER